MKLTEAFSDKYRSLLGEKEADAFLTSLSQEEPISAFRINPLKAGQKAFSDPIPNTPWGYYGKLSGKSKEHITGLIYSQEPAAQMVAQVAGIEKGMKVLDLAAAPGGKSTHILSYLDNTGLLVSNEISSKRSKVLVENLERFGARNVLITNDKTETLAKYFEGYFDVLIFDGPCSGEGMFRKDPDAMAYWDVTYPKTCASLQKDILKAALPMLRPGGRLIYATCTWSPEENEEVVAFLLDNFPYLELECIPKLNGMVEGIGMPEVARMYPHRFKGEGQFVARLRDTRADFFPKIPQEKKSNLTKTQLSLWQAFEKEHLLKPLTGPLEVFGDQLYLLPAGLPDLKGLKIARNGLHLGSFKTKRFEPSFALGLALRPDEVTRQIELSDSDFDRYVRGETIELSRELAKGWYQVTVAGNGLGFAKLVGKTLKNHFPKGLRLKN